MGRVMYCMCTYLVYEHQVRTITSPDCQVTSLEHRLARTRLMDGRPVPFLVRIPDICQATGPVLLIT